MTITPKTLNISGIEYRINNQIVAPELRIVDETGQNLGLMTRDQALAAAKERGVDLVEISSVAKPPVAKLISFDKFRYQKEKEEKKQKAAQKSNELKQIRITPRAADNDLQVKLRKTEEFLKEGHKVEIGIFLRGREKGNKEWALNKLKNFLSLIQTPHHVTMTPRPGGRGFVTQVSKK